MQVFKRYELKFILSKVQFNKLEKLIAHYMTLDSFGRHKIRNVYYDTDDYKVIRHSLEKPIYKEKLRLRLYGEASKSSEIFIELKKKFKGVVYKRRIKANYLEVDKFLNGLEHSIEQSQVLKEIEYFKNSFDDLKPKAYIYYEREAYFCSNDENFRMTFDFNIKCRNKDVSLYDSKLDRQILEDNKVLLEVKTVNGLPFWLTSFLSNERVYKTSFSKYGTAYNEFFLPEIMRRNNVREIDDENNLERAI